MKTKITEIFKVQHPIVLSGMSWISTPELVAAVANAGGLGILATGVLKPEQTKEFIKKARELTKKPFGANVTLYFPGSEKNARVIIDAKVPIVNYALGKGDWIAKEVHAYGGKVIATVTTLKHALAAERDGADALLVTGHEAAGHGGEVTSLALIPYIADNVKIPVIAAGGFADGRGLLAALALGAEGVAMGSRLMNTRESPVHESQKKMANEKNAEDTIYTDRFDGIPARMMSTPGAKRLIKKKLNPFSALIRSRQITKLLGLPWIKLAIGIIISGPKAAIAMARMAIGFRAFEVGTMEGDNENGILPLGQITGIMHDTPTVKEVITRVVKQAADIHKGIAPKIK